MRARLGNTNDPFVDVEKICINGRLYNAEDIEFEKDGLVSEEILRQVQTYWTDMKNKAAIAAMQGLCANPNYVGVSSDNIVKESVINACKLIKELKL